MHGESRFFVFYGLNPALPVECGGDVVHLFPFHLDHVETDGHVLPGAHEEIPRDVGIPLPLVPLHRLRGRAEGVRKARLDLAEHHRFPVLRDDVRLAEGGAVVAFQDLVAAPFQVSRGEFFSLSAENFFVNVLRCISHNPYSLIASRCAFVP